MPKRVDESESPSAAPPDGSGHRNDEVARRAYDLYEARGGEHGRDLDDWTQAERELAGEGTSGDEQG
ncbi:MAG: hypothetical protein JWL71_4892 [Acidobacteria bacterium]|nr:hypothetical protein [Acidobacteriota bacterium]